MRLINFLKIFAWAQRSQAFAHEQIFLRHVGRRASKRLAVRASRNCHSASIVAYHSELFDVKILAAIIALLAIELLHLAFFSLPREVAKGSRPSM